MANDKKEEAQLLEEEAQLLKEYRQAVKEYSDCVLKITTSRLSFAQGEYLRVFGESEQARIRSQKAMLALDSFRGSHMTPNAACSAPTFSRSI